MIKERKVMNGIIFKKLVDGIAAISSFVTLEEAGRTWYQSYKSQKREFEFDSGDINNEVIQRGIDIIKQALGEQEEKNIIREDEIKEIKTTLHKKLVGIDYADLKKIDNIADDVIEALNKYINKQVTVGEKILINRSDEILKKVTDMGNCMSFSQQKKQKVKMFTLKPSNVSNIFIYRENEKSEIEKMLLERKSVNVYGIGGIGKTTILEAIFSEFHKENKFILGWVKYTNNLKDDLLTQCNLFEGQESYDDKCNMLNKFIKEEGDDMLLFIDNVSKNIISDPFWEYINSNIQIIISSRNSDIDDRLYSYKINPICEENSINLFWKYYDSTELQYYDNVKCLVNKIKCHTMMIEMAAKAAKNSLDNIDLFIENLLNKGFAYSEEEILTSNDNIEATIAQHIVKLFEMQHFTELEKYILTIIAIIDCSSIPKEICDWISINDRSLKKEFSNLISLGWIKKKSNGISMHPVIREAIMLQEKPTCKILHVFVGNLLKMGGDYYSNNNGYDEVVRRIRIVEKILDFYYPYSGEDKIYVLDLMNDFSNACYEQSLFKIANKYIDREIEANCNEYGLESKYTINAILHRIKLYCHMKEPQKVLEQCKNVYQVVCELGNEDRVLLFHFREYYIRVLIETGNYDLADTEISYALGMKNSDITEDMILRIKMEMVSLLIKKFEIGYSEYEYLDEAENILLDMREEQQKYFDNNSIEKTVWYLNMANIFSYRADYKKAAEYDELILNERKKIYKDGNGAIAEVYYQLADDYYKLSYGEGKPAYKAKEYIDLAKEIAENKFLDTEFYNIITKLSSVIEKYNNFCK